MVHIEDLRGRQDVFHCGQDLISRDRIRGTAFPAGAERVEGCSFHSLGRSGACFTFVCLLDGRNQSPRVAEKPATTYADARRRAVSMTNKKTAVAIQRA